MKSRRVIKLDELENHPNPKEFIRFTIQQMEADIVFHYPYNTFIRINPWASKYLEIILSSYN